MYIKKNKMNVPLEIHLYVEQLNLLNLSIEWTEEKKMVVARMAYTKAMFDVVYNDEIENVIIEINRMIIEGKK